jgi:3-phosphoshikimate 1-carboxyvinyltransferase
MAAAAEGTTCIRDASELKVKETDRITTISENLRAMGGIVIPNEDGLVIEGRGAESGPALKGSLIRTGGDHRIAMAFSVAALIANGQTTIDDEHCVEVSYPGFYRDLNSL